MRLRTFLFIVLFLLAIHIILNVITVTTVTRERVTAAVPYDVVVPYEKAERRLVETCTHVPYNWTYEWGEWLTPAPDVVSPTYLLTNLERQPGTFHVRYAFFEEAVYQFDTYEDIDYVDAKNDIVPAFHSENLTVPFDGAETRRITIPTTKPNDVPYWVYAEVAAPSYERCNFTEREVNVVEQRTETKYDNRTEMKETREKITLWQLFMEKMQA